MKLNAETLLVFNTKMQFWHTLARAWDVSAVSRALHRALKHCAHYIAYTALTCRYTALHLLIVNRLISSVTTIIKIGRGPLYHIAKNH